MIPPVTEADLIQQFLRSRPSIAIAAHQFVRQQHVLLGRQSRDELIGLKNKPNFPAPEHREFVFRQLRDLFAVEPDFAGRS